MSRSLLHRLRIRLAGFLTRSPPDDPDRVLVGLCRALADTVSALQLMLSTDGRDTDEIPGFDELADREAALIRRSPPCRPGPCSGWWPRPGARCCAPRCAAYDGATTLALSAAKDLVRLAAGPGQPLSADPALPGLPSLDPPRPPCSPTPPC